MSTVVVDGSDQLQAGSSDRDTQLAPIEWKALAVLAGAKVAFHLATATLYGLHRDEFYYLAAGSHPAAGYVDQPPITPLLYRGWSSLFGASELALHSLAAILSIPIVVLAALLARELGGGRWAQRATMTVAAVGTVFTTTFHFVSTVTVDLVLWALATWLLIRLLRTGDRRLWAPIGLVAGLGFENKHTIVLWCAAVAVGLLVTRRIGLLASGWIIVGCALFALVAAPNIVWEATHHWASLSFYSALRRRTGGQNLAQFWPVQVGLMTIAGTALVVQGLRWARRDPRGALYRPLAVVFAVVVVVVFATAGKGYYAAGVYLPMAAAGAVAVETIWSARSRRRLLGAVLVTGILFAPLTTPMLPASSAVTLGLTKTNPDLGGMLGWHDVVDQLAAVYRGLPASGRASAAFLTRDYSEAAALSYWRAADKLPPAISGHNSEWWWGWAPAAHARTVIAVGLSSSQLRHYFGSVIAAGALSGAKGPIDPLQADLPVWICTRQLVSWPEMWPQLRFYT
ncbi:MAG TPA: glycosyltransferase family 39 protein [Acidimicrobiales bacterium]|nr:glycosyltransferase family 39 protein [Acidimicrobiales bacterium]